MPAVLSDLEGVKRAVFHEGGEAGPAMLDPASDVQVLGGRYWDRTSDPLGVNEVLSR